MGRAARSSTASLLDAVQLRLPQDDHDVAVLIAGVDEAGRGPLAGPVVAAAVILDPRRPISGLADSKILTATRRERLYDEIRAQALCCAVAEASVEEIDRLNILQATLLAMRRAVEALRLRPGRVLVDGNRLPVLRMACEAIVRGDATVPSISAASILAKVHRDRLCQALHDAHPGYDFARHKGYPSPDHLAALARLGACAAHRRSFAPVRRALEAVGGPREPVGAAPGESAPRASRSAVPEVVAPAEIRPDGAAR